MPFVGGKRRKKRAKHCSQIWGSSLGLRLVERGNYVENYLRPCLDVGVNEIDRQI